MTDREYRIVRLVLLDYKNPEICRELSISPGTLRNALSQIYKKYGYINRDDLRSRYGK